MSLYHAPQICIVRDDDVFVREVGRFAQAAANAGVARIEQAHEPAVEQLVSSHVRRELVCDRDRRVDGSGSERIANGAKGDRSDDQPHARGPLGKSGFARERNLTPGQLAIAWVLAKQPTLVPVIGARTPAQIESALEVLVRPLSQEEVRTLEALVPSEQVKGTRYAEQQMQHLDSEQ